MTSDQKFAVAIFLAVTAWCLAVYSVLVLP